MTLLKKRGLPLVISLHRLRDNYEFDWRNIKILDREPSFIKNPYQFT